MRALAFMFAVTVSIFTVRSNVQAAAQATFAYGMSAWVESADGNTIYAAVPNQNSVAVINAHTLHSTLVGIGSNPTGLCLSTDGSTLYVANNGSNFLGVLSTSTLSVKTPIALGSGVNPQQVLAGTNNRLWVLTGALIEQIDATTGASTGPNVGAYNGSMAISPDAKTLYYANSGISPSSEAKLDVSGTTPVTEWNPSQGGDGRGISLSHDGSLVAFPNAGSNTSIFQTSSMLALGSVGGGGIAPLLTDGWFAPGWVLLVAVGFCV